MNSEDISTLPLVVQGQVLLSQGKMEQAAECFSGVLAEEPENIDAAAGLGFAMVSLERYPDAIAALELAVAKAPKNAGYLEALGVAYAYAGKVEAAERALRKSVRFGEWRGQTIVNLAAVLNEIGKFDEAEAMFKNCLRREPDHLQARYNYGLLKLLKGEYEEGWKGFELRNEVVGRGAPAWAQRSSAADWHGEDLEGRSILIYAEQGLGDAIQFVRYAILLSETGSTVTLQCPDALTKLVGGVKGVSRCVSTDNTVDDVDYKVSLLSLPGLTGTTGDTIPDPSPYIPVSGELTEKWDSIFAGYGEMPKVGLVWAGNPDNKTDYKRSVSLPMLEPLLAHKDICLFSLQIGEAAGEIAKLESQLRPHTIFENILPFEEVAAVVKNLDLLISVDTAMAHLAGALEKPVWTMITHFPDWRWQLGRNDTPWYRSMRLFRQPGVGDWESVVRDVDGALQEWLLDRQP